MTNENRKELEGKEVTGRITRVDDKGFGFIISPELKFTRIFFHWTSLIQDTLRFDELKKGMFCSFTLKYFEGREPNDKAKGWRAIKIKIIDTPKTEFTKLHVEDDDKIEEVK